MAKCTYCGSFIVFGGVRDGDARYCNDKCAAGGAMVNRSWQIPADVVRQEMWAVHQGACPACHKPGPVDVHTAHQIWSLVYLTSWKSVPQVSCRSCGRKRQATSLLFCLVAGWWGIPWGLVMTPVQIYRNLAGMAKGPDPLHPSPDLERMVRLHLVQRSGVAA